MTAHPRHCHNNCRNTGVEAGVIVPHRLNRLLQSMCCSNFSGSAVMVVCKSAMQSSLHRTTSQGKVAKQLCQAVVQPGTASRVLIDQKSALL
jgi:hypothetical protein